VVRRRYGHVPRRHHHHDDRRRFVFGHDNGVRDDDVARRRGNWFLTTAPFAANV
jgi:hypothetical protein